MIFSPLLQLRAAPRPLKVYSCRRVAGRRFPVSAHSFHTRLPLLSRDDGSANAATANNTDTSPTKDVGSLDSEHPRPPITSETTNLAKALLDFRVRRIIRLYGLRRDVEAQGGNGKAVASLLERDYMKDVGLGYISRDGSPQSIPEDSRAFGETDSNHSIQALAEMRRESAASGMNVGPIDQILSGELPDNKSVDRLLQEQIAKLSNRIDQVFEKSKQLKERLSEISVDQSNVDRRPAPFAGRISERVGEISEAPMSEQSLEDNTKDAKSSGNYSYESSKKRTMRNRLEPRVVVPSWFVDQNVRNFGDSSLQQPKALQFVKEKDPDQLRVPNVPDDAPLDGGEGSTPATPESSNVQSTGEADQGAYHISQALMEEIVYTAASGLQISSNNRKSTPNASKPHILLQSPKEGAEVFLDHVVQKTAERLEVDTISIDAQDISDVALANANFLTDDVLDSLRLLSFDSYVDPDGHLSPPEDEEGMEDVAEDEDDGVESWLKPTASAAPTASQSRSKLNKLSNVLKTIFPGVKSYRVVGTFPTPPPPQGAPWAPMHPLPGSYMGGTGIPDREEYLSFVDTFLDAAVLKKRKLTSLQTDQPELDSTQTIGEKGSDKPSTKGLIVHVKDYLEIKATRIGPSLLNTIREAVDRRRQAGQPIIIIGTTASEPPTSKSDFRSIQADIEETGYRNIITPCKSPDVDALFTEDDKYTTKMINCRNILAILRQGATAPQQLSHLSLERDLGLGSDQVFTWGLNEVVWTYDQVHRMASIALGMIGKDEAVSTHHLEQALMIIESSDDSKFEWLDKEKAKTSTLEPPTDQSSSKQVQDARIKQLQKTCNKHERKLLSGVIDSGSINTTFEDVQAPPSTVEALKTLTSLSLIRPDAFTYGVLATDKIPGLLLYGPPGTGKTLLAKAVAKESGATVLEVSGSDVFDMYVGEGEKNVRAIFSLAKKLSPCVVFIDEADAIFGSRNTSSNRTSHRELINQFLREWDGMNTMSAFIMVATNRPFDLDDAVLRRLPRRLLVDLPTEKDRESILEIHLKDEDLASDVSLASIASKTPFYSGSDLKNLSVAAALACVTEENAAAANHTGEDEYKYPPRRKLTNAHFEKALQEISASISEDMSSLTAIRKFDEKYGDRKGRRKKPGGWGFGTLSEKEKEKLNQEEGRIRSADAGNGT